MFSKKSKILLIASILLALAFDVQSFRVYILIINKNLFLKKTKSYYS
jgi:hypothetical protein